MDWDHIRIFLAVARTGQIASAARQLKLDHATVSRRLSTFEATLSCQLFERSPMGCVMTLAGEQLLAYAERIESQVLTFQSMLTSADGTLSGTVKVGAADGIGTFFLAPELAGLVRKNPSLILQVVPLPRTFSVSKREVDIAISLDMPEDGRLICQKIVDYRLFLYASADYLGSMPELRDWSHARNHVLVTTVTDILRSPTVNYLDGYTGEWKSRYECANLAGQVEAVRAGAGVAVLPAYVASRFSELVRVGPDVSFQRTYWLVSHPDSRGIARIELVRRAIVDRARQMRGYFAGETPWGTELGSA